MSKQSARPAVRLLAIAAGVGLIAYLILRAGPGNLWQELVKLGWGFTLVIALAGVAHLVKTWAWQMTLGKDRHRISFLRLLGLRLGSEAAAQLGILGQTFGDSIRVSQLSREVQMANSLASVTLDRGFFIVSGIVVAMSGILAALPVLSHSHALRLYAGLFVFGSAAFLLLTLLAVRKRWPVLSGAARKLRRVPRLKRWVDQEPQLVQSTEDALFDFHHKTPGLFWGSFALNLAGQCLAILEVCVVLWLLGAHIGFIGALIVEGLTKLLNAVGNFNPGNIGTYEGGNMLIGKIFSLSSATGLALALARRLRALFWTAAGCICLVRLTRSKKLQGLGTVEKEEKMNSTDASSEASSSFKSGGVAFAIFLPPADTGRPTARVGSLPIPLRIILVAKKMNAAQIVFVADPQTAQSTHRELARTRRLPASVQWLETNAEAPLQEQLRLLAGKVSSPRVVLVDGTTVYNTSLIQKANEWNNDGTTLTVSRTGLPAGLYAMSARTLPDLIEVCPLEVRGLPELHASIRTSLSLASMYASEDLWQRVRTEEDRHVAEEKLDCWLVKPTDGMYARFNRRISIPISRQLIKFPITANMVSIFTLGVGIASAGFFAFGGYWHTLVGAFLCLFASILDGCDGEVARLKLMESDFGCWLETVCDYLFYLFLLVGMTIGQWRSSGSKAYLFWGGLLLLGALASFLAVGRQRRRLAAGRPDQYLGIWHTQARSRSSNPFLYVARHTEFIARRCFFPYALVCFALLGIMNVAFILSVVAANLVWPFALYTSRAFSRSSSPVPATAVSV